MNTQQIDSILRRILPKNKVNFLGVFARDQIPYSLFASSNNFPLCFVANTDPSTQPGEHWVAFFLSSPNKIEFFDSYGLHPRVYDFTLPVTTYNHTQYQTFDSKVCGYFCILYLYSRTHCRCKLDTHLSNSNLAWNDAKVAKWVRSLKVSPNHPCTTIHCVQSCKCRNHNK